MGCVAVEQLRPRLRLYAITPGGLETAADFDAACRRVIDQGVTAIQFRSKRLRDPIDLRRCAMAVQAVCAAADVLFVVNDALELACELGAAALHLGPDDVPIQIARARLGPDCVIGASAASVALALAAESAGADYLVVGAIFDASPSKDNGSPPQGVGVLQEMRRHPQLASIPIVAIGGITAATAASCFAAGADGVAAIRAFFDPAAASLSEQLSCRR